MNPSRRDAMRTIAAAGAALALPRGLAAQSQPTTTAKSPEVAAIYFPGWHEDDHYSAWYGERWTEWQLIRDAKQRCPEQRLLKPHADWGYFDEAYPRMMERQIDLAAASGIDAFIVDWYWYSGVRFLNRPVEQALPRAANRDKIKYGLMWANHNWMNVFPAKYGVPNEIQIPIRHSADDFARAMGHCIETHFHQPNFWRVNGGLYFGLFSVDDFIAQLGGPVKAKATLDAARDQVRKAGLGEMHFAAFTWTPGRHAEFASAGFDSITSYTISTVGIALPEQPTQSYDVVADAHAGHWAHARGSKIPYLPIVSAGWDPSYRWQPDVPWPPRPTPSYPYCPLVTGSTPERFGKVVGQALRHARANNSPAIVINSWNEWTEGSALLPEAYHGTGYLDALKRAKQEATA